ncbi:MAG: efflux RND transporter periplasmic adaptor subunit [Woeseia sp.]
MKCSNRILAPSIIGIVLLALALFAARASDEPREAGHDSHAGHDEHDSGSGVHDQHTNPEGSTRISESAAEAAGIRVEHAGERTIGEIIELTGTVETDPARISIVRPRFAGVVTQVHRTVGDPVKQGDTLATVETNESLTQVPVLAPISGIVLERSVQIGQVTGTDPLFVIADPEIVWVQLDVFANQLPSIEKGQPVELTTLGGRRIRAQIDWIAPVMAHGSQSVKARAVVPNTELELRPGQFVKARVVVDEIDVPLAVRRSAVQRYRDSDAVFVKDGDAYEARRLELGRRDAEYVEVLGGLEEGEVYVAENSYLIKADIEKAGASHSH